MITAKRRMKYNLANDNEVKLARDYLEELIKKKSQAEVKRVIKRRSLNQNRYLHLLLGYFGSHFGYTLEEAKVLYKQLNPTVYVYRKGKHTFLKSSAELDTSEMTKTIDSFREQSKAMGFPLPSATDEDWLRQVENDIERAGYYL
jgi:hypothetical protein